jgi:hypothetical protein
MRVIEETYFISAIKKFVVLVKAVTLVSLMFNFIKLGAYQHCISSVSDCSRVKFSAEFIVRKIVILANNSYLEHLITLKVGNILKSRGPKTDYCGTPERTSKENEMVSKMHAEDRRLVR